MISKKDIQRRTYPRMAGGVLAGMVLVMGLGSLWAQEVSSSKNDKVVAQGVTSTFSIPSVAAKVNGTEIPMQKFWERILSQSGTPVLLSMIDDVLIEQAAEGKIALPATSAGKPDADAKKSKKQNLTSAKWIEPAIEKQLTEIKTQFKDKKIFEEQLKKSGQDIESLKRQIRLDLYKRALIEDKIKVSKKEIKKYFEENKQRLGAPEQVHLKHILVATEKDANEVMSALKAGKNFESLAKEKSKDEATKDRGGDLGFIVSATLIPEIQNKVAALKKGEMNIAQTPQGFHVLKLLEVKPAKEASLDTETQKRIEQLLMQEKFNREYPEYIQALRKQADIQVFLTQQKS